VDGALAEFAREENIPNAKIATKIIADIRKNFGILFRSNKFFSADSVFISRLISRHLYYSIFYATKECFFAKLSTENKRKYQMTNDKYPIKSKIENPKPDIVILTLIWHWKLEI